MFSSIHNIHVRNLGRRLFEALTTGAAHLLGVAVVFAVTCWLLLPGESRAALYEAAHHGLVASMTPEIALHAGLSACLWALIVIIWKLALTPTPDTSRRVVKSRGAVMLETIVVFPVFLMVTLGLIQLALLNTSGLLTTLGAFNAGRTVAVWHPEAMEQRNDVNQDTVEEKARLAAAAAVAPAAPSDFTVDTQTCGQSDSLEARLEALADAGHQEEAGVTSDGRFSLTAAFDQSSFTHRGQSKLQFAHCATDVEYMVGNDNEVLTRVEYQQHMAMPFVHRVFGEMDTVAGRTAMYNTLSREHRTTHQIQPNDCPPGGFMFSCW